MAHHVPTDNYRSLFVRDKSKKVDREIDFYLIKDGQQFLCEVKLIGAGNSESADAVITRATNVFVADKLSIQNKNQLDTLNIHWVEMRSENGFQRFKLVLERL